MKGSQELAQPRFLVRTTGSIILFAIFIFTLTARINAQEMGTMLGDQYIFWVEDGRSGCAALPTHQAESLLGFPLYGRADFSSSLGFDAPISGFTTSNFEVSLTGFSAEAAAAFQHAINIWASSLVSPVTIRVDAAFAALPMGVLGTGGGGLHRDFSGAPVPGTWYATALASKLAGMDLVPGQAHVSMTFNSNVSNWYFGTNAQPAGNQFDFVTVALHELAHGLGFGDSFDVDGSNVGSWGVGTGFPFIYDRFTETGDGTALLNEAVYPNPSMELASAIQSNDVFFDGVFSNKTRLFAPNPYAPGSSIAHLDEATFPAGNANSLMTPILSQGEAQHNVGNLTLAIFEDTGWSVSSGCNFLCDVGIGTTEPQRQLHLVGSNAVFRMDRTSDTAAFMLVRTTSGGSILKNFVVGTNASGSNNGEFIINDLGTGSGGAGTRRMTIGNTGVVTFTGNVVAPNFVTSSSIRYKSDVETLQETDRILDRLRGVSFNWKETGKASLGMIAEEVAEVLPEAVSRDEKSGELEGINYSALVAVLVEALKDQQRELQSLRDEVSILKAFQAGIIERERQQDDRAESAASQGKERATEGR